MDFERDLARAGESLGQEVGADDEVVVGRDRRAW